jgi:hypothetical protein
MKANFIAQKDLATGKTLNYDDMSAMARDAFNKRKLSPTQFISLMGLQKKSFTQVQEQFRDRVFDMFPKIGLNVKTKDGSFAFKPTSKVADSKTETSVSVDLSRGFFNDDEAALTYAEFIKAMNIAIAEGETKGWGVEDMYKRFEELTSEDQTAWNSKTAAEYLERAENAMRDRKGTGERTSVLPTKPNNQ